MNERLLGMYIHMHWAYNYPYAARTWSVGDWSAYLSGLRALGYNLVQIWPMLDIMPLRLTRSDRIHLDKLRQVIDIAHRFGMTVYVGATANTMGNDKAADYDFDKRPYFAAERRINPGDKGEVLGLMKARRIFLEPLAQADGFWIIDSDPGGYTSSPVGEFVQLFEEHRNLLDSLRPGIKLLYWMWCGWTDQHQFDTDWKDNPQRCWGDALERIMNLDAEPWGILACWRGHFAVAENLGLVPRTLYFPYSTIEDEPSFPLTNYDHERIHAAFNKIPQDSYPMGIMGNAQSHCLQLPHTYLFQHFAYGGTKEQIDLQGFGEDLLPGFGSLLANAWVAMGGEDLAALESAAAALAGIPVGTRLSPGRLSGLYFRQADLLVDDLKAQIALKIEILKVREQIARRANITSALKNMVQTLQVWSERHGFAERYYGPFRDLLHPILKEISKGVKGGEQLSRALDDFDSGQPHGAFSRIFETLKAAVNLGQKKIS